MNLPNSIVHLLSPVDRLFFTFPPHAALEAFGLEIPCPAFIFGEGKLQKEIISSTADAIDLARRTPAGIYVVNTSSIDLKALFKHCLENELITLKHNKVTSNLDDSTFFVSQTWADVPPSLTNHPLQRGPK